MTILAFAYFFVCFSLT